MGNLALAEQKMKIKHLIDTDDNMYSQTRILKQTTSHSQIEQTLDAEAECTE